MPCFTFPAQGKDMKNLIMLSVLILPMISLAQDEGSDTRAAVSSDQLKEKRGLYYENKSRSKAPYTGLMRDFHPNGQKKLEGRYLNGKQQGAWASWHENGQKAVEVSFAEGTQVGRRTTWYNNGQKKHEANWIDGKADGLSMKWYENGQKEIEGRWIDGEQDGFWTSWHENGQRKTEVNWCRTDDRTRVGSLQGQPSCHKVIL